MMGMHAGNLAVGSRRDVVLVEDLTRTQIVQYAGASGDFNPLHTDEVYATRVAGHDSVMAHGMLTMGLTARALTDWLGEGRLLRYGVRFLAPVLPGDRLTARLEVREMRTEEDCTIAEIVVSTINQAGAEVLTGYAAGRLDV